MLRALKRANADTNTLITVYTTIIRPVLEYACQVWHFNIQEYLSKDIEQIQRRAFRILFPLMSYREVRDFTGIPLLKERRESLCEQFFKKNENNDKLSELLHHKATTDYDMRPRCKYSNYSYIHVQYLCKMPNEHLNVHWTFLFVHWTNGHLNVHWTFLFVQWTNGHLNVEWTFLFVHWSNGHMNVQWAFLFVQWSNGHWCMSNGHC